MMLFDFHSIRPTFETSQEKTLNWLVAAHTQAEKTKGMNESDLVGFRQTIQDKLWHVGCKPDTLNQKGIQKRGHCLGDFLHEDWDRMEIYPINQSPEGKNLSVRSKYFEQYVDLIFEEYYPEESKAPNHLIHVSCTGYVSPSGAQKIVSKRNWGQQTIVTHAYHMGCYASMPAIRMGLGFSHSNEKNIDIVHTEVCSLHSNPSLHQLDQLVSQSLFADGFMKYTLSQTSPSASHLKIIALSEEIISHSTGSMTWSVADWGFQMTLAREIPVFIARNLKDYLKRLALQAGISYDSLVQDSIFAIHPGGPRILLNIQELLSLSESQMFHSFQILKDFGNMSSATLPHIWQVLLNDEKIKDKTRIVSLAFGPGLTISGSIMEKICGS